MSYVTFAVGLLLAICGGAAMSFGYGIVNNERGWASLIAGSAALSGGVVTMALALVLHSLRRLRAALIAAPAFAARPQIAEGGEPEADGRVFDSRRSARRELDEAEVAAAQRTEAPPEAAPRSAGGPREPALATPAPALERSPEEPAPVHAPLVAPAPAARSAPAAPARTESQGASIDDVRRLVAQTIKGRPDPSAAPSGAGGREEPSRSAPAPAGAEPAPRRRLPLGSLHLPRAVGLGDLSAPRRPTAAETAVAPRPDFFRDEREAEWRPDPASPESAAAPSAEPASPRPVAPSPPDLRDARVAIGRYESDGTAYVMFADGSIEASSERGVFRFRSMSELKSFMESQPRGET